jgi:metacaspase-1
MRAIARKHRFATALRLTKSATRNRILAALKRAAKKLRRHDMFFLSYSGHGGQVPNTGNDFEPDGFDETWCLYDGELIDDELYTALGSFAAGVRIFVLSDSCHSGTVLREARFAALGVRPARPRMMPRDIALRVYMEHEEFYDKLQQRGKDFDLRSFPSPDAKQDHSEPLLCYLWLSDWPASLAHPFWRSAGNSWCARVVQPLKRQRRCPGRPVHDLR